jgi:hypothetical protein
LSQLKCLKEKFKKVRGAEKRKIFSLRDSGSNSSHEGENDNTVQRKISHNRKKEKVQILMVLPKSWSIRKIQQEFKTSNYMVRTSKKLMAEKGILSSPNVKRGKVLPPPAAEMVKQFYVSDEICSIMPGTEYYVSVN